MTQIFIVGSSNVYGVGGENGGWADYVKRSVHKKMYGRGGVWEKYEVFNFGKSGATIDFVSRTYPQQLADYGRGGKIITIVSVGGNNSKAQDTPDNIVSTPEEFKKEMSMLFDLVKSKSSHVISLGSDYIDESKTNPKISPFDGSKAYFTNARRQEYAGYTKQLCQEKGVTFVEVEVSQDEWVKNYVSEDGLHPNDAGYEIIGKKVMEEVEKLL